MVVIKGRGEGEGLSMDTNRAKSNEKQLVITDAEPTIKQETLE